MTFKKVILNPIASTDIKNQLQNALQDCELSFMDNSNHYTSGSPVDDKNLYKLCEYLSFTDKLVEINQSLGSKLIAGAISEISENPGSRDIVLGKSTFVKMDDKITSMEGLLITPDSSLKFYTMIQTDDIFRSNTVGKIVECLNSFLYLTPDGDSRTQGEYELSKAKKLQFSSSGPTIARRPSGISLMTPKPALSRTPSRSGIPPPSRRSFGSTKAPEVPTPRAIIYKYQLVNYV